MEGVIRILLEHYYKVKSAWSAAAVLSLWLLLTALWLIRSGVCVCVWGGGLKKEGG